MPGFVAAEGDAATARASAAALLPPALRALRDPVAAVRGAAATAVAPLLAAAGGSAEAEEEEGAEAIGACSQLRRLAASGDYQQRLAFVGACEALAAHAVGEEPARPTPSRRTSDTARLGPAPHPTSPHHLASASPPHSPRLQPRGSPRCGDAAARRIMLTELAPLLLSMSDDGVPSVRAAVAALLARRLPGGGGEDCGLGGGSEPGRVLGKLTTDRDAETRRAATALPPPMASSVGTLGGRPRPAPRLGLLQRRALEAANAAMARTSVGGD